jgi:hypothetical protein
MTLLATLRDLTVTDNALHTLMSYGKIFDSLYTGSMVGAGINVFAVWGYVIANAKPPGIIELNPKLLAATFGCDVEPIVKAIECLCAPDPESRTKEYEGRRLLPEGQFLYRIPTWAKYNQIRNEVERREKNREYARAYRERQARKMASGDVSTDDAYVSTDALTDQQNQPIRSVRTDSTSSVSVEEEHEEEKPTVASLRPDDVPVDLWEEWVSFRRTKRATVTKRVLDSTRRTATEAGMTMAEAFTYWIANGQTGFFPPKNAKAKPAGRQGGFDRWGKWQGVPGDLKPEDYSAPLTEENDVFCELPVNLMKRENAQRATKGLPPLSSMAELKILYPEAF